MKKTIAIVGAGPCGLVALKETLGAGHYATIFERNATLGGVFVSTAIYPNLHLTISNWAMAFSDFQDWARLHYPTAEHYLEYLKKYAKHFDLERHIRYGTEIKSASLNSKGRWIVRSIDKSGREAQHTFDALIVATGANQVPKPLPSELCGFAGRTIHSAEYNAAFTSEVKDKQLKVLIVGGGESAADISAELSTLSPDVSVWLRRPMCIGPRYLNEKSEVEQMELNKLQQLPANGFLEAATTGRLSTGQNVYVYGFFRQLLWRAPILNRTLSRMCLASTQSAWAMNDQATYVTKNQRMCEALHDGQLEVLVAPEVSAARHTVQFLLDDGVLVDRQFDVIVNCTGFATAFPWLKVDNLENMNPRKWWHHCFPPGLGEKLFFVGYARPHQGGIPMMAEMLSRYIALLLSGEERLPENYGKLAKQDERAARQYYHISPDLHSLVDYNAFLESVARRIGCEPRLPASCILAYNIHVLCALLLAISCSAPRLSPVSVSVAIMICVISTIPLLALHNGILIKWWFYPHWSVWYRQRGLGSNPAALKSTLDQVNIWQATAITRGFVLLLLWSVPLLYVQYVVSFLVFAIERTMRAAGLRFGSGMGRLLRPKMFVLHGTEWRWWDLFMP
jgi:dimethylaniline monooxygenase (N-oxide forming)